MQKGLQWGTIGLMVITLMLMLVYFDTDAAVWKAFTVISGTLFYHVGIRWGILALIDYGPEDWFDWRRWIYTPRRYEKALYDKLRVGDWKAYVPVLRPSLYSPREHSWDDILLTMCQTEFAHALGALGCLIPMILGPLLFKGFWAFFITGLLLILAEMCFIIVQRYNRPRVIAMLRKREREEAARARRNAF